MEQYTLNTLMMFFKLQQILGYETIDAVVGIMEDQEIADHHVKPYIRRFLRDAGLNEVGHKEGKFLPSPEYAKILENFLKPKRPVAEITVNRWRPTLNLLSGQHLIAIIMN